MGHHSPCFDFIWVNDFEPFGDLSLFSRACEPQVDWSCLMLSSDPMFRRYQPRTFPFSEEDEDERLCPNHRDLPVPRSNRSLEFQSVQVICSPRHHALGLERAQGFSQLYLPPVLAKSPPRTPLFRLESYVILMLKDS